MHVYILKLKNDKFYIGSTEKLKNRIQQHYDGYGSAWTRKYSPIKVVETFENCSRFDEDKYTKEYMAKFGIDNVRGGTYCEINIEEYRNQLEKELEHSANKCFNCGGSGHLSNNCRKSRHKKQIKTNCKRCSRANHLEENCYAKTDKQGNCLESESEYSDSEYENDEYEYSECWVCDFCNKEFSTKKGVTYHQNFYCTKKNKKSRRKCENCGRTGHIDGICYAKTHIDGYPI